MLLDGEKGVVVQRDNHSYAVILHFYSGIVTPSDLKIIAEAGEKLNIPHIKLTSSGRIAFIGLSEETVDRLWKEFPLQQGQIIGRTGRYVKVCPGSTWCRMGNCETIPLGKELDERYHGESFPGKIKIGVSGCANQCAENCIKDIALMATKKGWRVQVGGNGGGRPRFAKELARALSEKQALNLIANVLTHYKTHAKPNQRLGAFIEKCGWDRFRQQIISAARNEGSEPQNY